ncbi:MAG: hypothetical protein QOH19_2538 [Actinomycetota bacterium]|jgi:hypothetical protein|nr:hypothetical protein [Actinomycetota bacterium]
MTENQWQERNLAVPQATQTATAYDSGVTSGSPGSDSKTDLVKEEAANVAGQAAGSAQNVAQTAKAEAANVASEVKTNARDLLQQAKSDLTSQAGVQQEKAAAGIRSISSQLHAMAEAPEQQGVASDLIRQAADRSASVASWLENRDPGSLLHEVKSFARQRPAAFLLLAAGAGMLAGRLGRSLQAGAPDTTTSTGTAVPPQPHQPPVAEGRTVSGAGEPFNVEAPLGEPAYGGQFGEPARPSGTGPASAQTLPTHTSAGVTLRDGVDPYAAGGGRQL